MENLGEKLKQARLAKNLSLDEIHRITKINKNYLVALENSDVKAFPAEVYYKNFLRRYANYLGLDGDLILLEYNQTKGKKQPETEFKKDIKSEAKKTDRKFFIVITFIIFILALIFMNYLINIDAKKTENEIDNLFNTNFVYTKKDKQQQNNNTGSITVDEVKQKDVQQLNKSTASVQNIQPPVSVIASSNAGSTKKVDISTASVQKKQQFVSVSTSSNVGSTKKVDISTVSVQKNQQPVSVSTNSNVNSAVKVDISTASAQKNQQPVSVKTSSNTTANIELKNTSEVSEQKLVVKAKYDTWLVISADGNRKFRGLISAGKQETFYAKEVFSIKIGNVLGVDVFFNDKQVDILKGASEKNTNTLELKKKNEK